MSFTRSTTNTTVHQNMPDYPSSEGYTAATLKTAFDAPATGLKGDINRLETELEDTSSASNLGASPIVVGDDSDANVQAKLEKLYADLQGISQGSIPDGTITEEKINATYEATLAKKDGTLQTGLNAEQLNGKTEAQLKTGFLGTPNPATISFTGAAKQTPTVTETKTYSTSGSRYYMMLFSYSDIKLAMYDAKTEKFVFATYLGRYPDGPSGNSNAQFAFNANNIPLLNSSVRGTATLNVAYSSGTMTLALTKAPFQSSSGADIPSGTITIFELGGIV
jgi:hypothetical protein